MGRLKLLPALALAACAGEPAPLAPVLDLAAEVELARVSAETSELVVGDDRVRPHLVAGWSNAEIDRELGRPFRWGVGPASEVAFHVVEPRAIEITLEGRPRPAPPGSRQGLTVAVNGEAAGRIDLLPELGVYRLPLAARLLERGDNRLTLGYDFAERTPIAGETRDLSLAWYGISFAGLGRSAGPPRADAEHRTLLIPWGTRLDYYLRPPAGAVLRVTDWRFAGAASGTLSVHLATDGAPERLAATLDDPAPVDLVLDVEPERAVRLSLTAVANDGDGGEGGVALTGAAVLAPAVPAPPPPEVPGASPGRSNLVVYLVDTLRSDRLGCYGNPRPVSPRIDQFAARATLFENARAQSSWTLSSVASIFTGVWPPAHGVLQPEHKLAAGAVTLAEHLRAAGYATAAIVTNGLVGEAHGTAQGFDDYLFLEHHESDSQRLFAEAVAWLEERDRSRPFFLYLHSIDPHTPYLPAEEFRLRHAAGAGPMHDSIVAEPRVERWPPTPENVAQLLALYDAEVAQNDAGFGDTIAELERRGLYEETLIVFLSDHGEEFFEHGSWNHGVNLYRETLDVPLIVKLPGQSEGRRVAELVEQIDLLPTLLHALGLAPGPESLPATPPIEGRSLMPLLLDPPAEPPAARAPAFSHVERRARAWAGIIDGGWKYVVQLDDGGPGRLYEWREDPQERHDRAAELPVLAGYLRTTVERRLRGDAPLAAEPAVLDEAARQNLRALGYID